LKKQKLYDISTRVKEKINDLIYKFKNKN